MGLPREGRMAFLSKNRILAAMIALLEKYYKPLMIVALGATVVLAYALGFADGTRGARSGVALACSDNVLQTLSIHAPETVPGGGTTTPTTKGTTPIPGTKSSPTTGAFVASKNGTKYYPADCSAVSRIKEENRVWFANEADAKLQGYTRTTTC